MASALKLENSSKQQCRSKRSKERFPVGRSYESSKYQGKLNCKDDQSCNQEGLKGKKTKDDELVKYMSNLPGYLKCEESGENSRGKALNFGVLDWSRLEEWNHNKESMPAKCGVEAASSGGSTLSSETPTTSASILREVSRDGLHKKHSRNLNYTSSHKHHRSQSVQPSYLSTRHCGESETTSNSTLAAHNKGSQNYSHEDGKREVSNQKLTSGTGNSSSKLRNRGYLPSLKDDGTNGWECENKMFEELRVIDNNKKPSNRRITFDMVSSSSKLRSNDISSSSREKLFAANEETSKIVQKPRGSTKVQRSTEQNNIVLLLPKKYALGSYLEEVPPSTDEGSVESKRSSFSDDSAHQEVGSTEFCYQIPQSCPLTFKGENSSESCMTAQDDKLSFDASKSSTRLGKTANLSDGEAKSTKVVRSTNTLDQDMAETVSRKSEYPPPNRRFSFGFNRLSRSSSFKDGPVVPQLSPSASIKSGPVRFEGSACMDDLSREKATGHNRARSSPLRRILDPLLKSKGLNSSGHNKTVLPSKGGASTSFSVKSITTNDLLQNGKHDAVMMQALVQFTVRNGVPLFQFVVDNNNSSILAATKKNLTLLGIDDCGEHYTFYSVNEVKKKSGSWRSHGSKDKHCGFVYNIVGQMKLDSIDIPPRAGLDNHSQHMVKESILFGVESGNEENTSSKLIKTTELAAVVVELQCGNWEGMLEKSYVNFHSLGEIEEKSSTTVILPGGVHSSPNKILPSPLIDRWRSGGSCDCGGWDVGCKLRVLSNRNQYQYHSTMKLEKAHLNPNSFELFVQEGSQMSLPVFTLVPLKNGIYTVQFDSSISMLQAFFTCVTIISCQKVGTADEAKEFQLPKSPNITVPVKFASNPPVSPVGRV